MGDAILDEPCTAFCDAIRGIEFAKERPPTHDDLETHFRSLGVELRNGNTHSLGTVEQLRGRADCTFCQLVLRAVCEGRDREALSGEVGLAKPISVFLPPGEDCFGLSYSSSTGTRLMFITEGNWGEVGSTMGPQAAKVVKGNNIRPSLVQEWLRNCEENHGDLCRHIPKNLQPGKYEYKLGDPAKIRLLDLTTGCLQRMPLETRYVALSYVCGQEPGFKLLKDNFDSLQAEGSLDRIKSQLSQTIIDAIDLVKSLDERYLWVDALCLVHDEIQDVKFGVEIMNSIYQSAYFTIIAGSGKAVSSGLPGVRPGSRHTSQIIAQLNPKVRLAAIHSLDWHLSQSVYGKRGWTLQESVLSYRTVIFINDQVYFRCRRSNWSEDTTADLSPNSPDSDDCSSAHRIPKFDDGNQAAWRAYQTLFEEYSNRELRFDGDAIRAAAGILRELTQCLDSFYVEGLPAYYLDLSLLWISSDGNMKRRPKFGSYSWAGWSGSIKWPSENYAWPEDSGEVSHGIENMYRWITEKRLVEWYLWGPAGSLESLSPSLPYGEPSKIASLVKESAESLPQHVVNEMSNPNTREHSIWSFGGGSSFGMRPDFKDRRRTNPPLVNTLFAMELVSTQAELEKLTSKITNTDERSVMYSWSCSGNCRNRMFEDRRNMSEDDTSDVPENRWAKDFIEYRDPDATVIKETGKEDFDKIKDRSDYPPYPLLHFHTISLKLKTGKSMSGTISDENLSVNRVPGLQLLTDDGDLVGSLHFDNIKDSSYAPGTEVELVILSRCFLPTAGSALPRRDSNRVGLNSGKTWDMFWVLHVVWKETAIAERRGIGQILDTALGGASGAGPEAKYVILA